MLRLQQRIRAKGQRQWRRVETRLREEADAARRQPEPGLRRRTLAALTKVSLEPRPASRRERQGWVTLAAAGVALALVASVTVTQQDRTPERPGPAKQVLAPVDTTVHPAGTDGGSESPFAIVIGVDTSRIEAVVQRQMERMKGSWAAPLLAEARLIVDDAREAGQLVNRLPVPPVRIERGHRSGAG